MAQGDIVIELSLDSKKMEIGIKNSGQLLRQFEERLGQTAKSMRRVEDATFSMGTKFRHLIVTLGNLRFAAMDVYDVFLRLPASVMKSAGEIERLQTLLKGLSSAATDAARSAEAARDFSFITNLAKNAPFDIANLTNSFVKLKAAGLDPTKGAMQALSDSVARFGGTGEEFKRASVAISQMLGKGKVSMEELRQQLGEAIPDAMQAMADGMRITMAELDKKVGDGMVLAPKAIAKMLAQLRINNDGAAEGMMQSWVGMLARLKTEWDLTASGIGNAGFMDAAKQAVGGLIEVMQSSEFKRFAQDFGAGLGEAVSWITKTVKTLVAMREEIGMVIGALIVYRASSSWINGDNFGRAQDGLKKLGEAYRDNERTARINAETRKRVAVEAAAAEVRAARDARNESRMAMLEHTANINKRLEQEKALQARLIQARSDAAGNTWQMRADGSVMSQEQSRRKARLVEQEALANSAALANLRSQLAQTQASYVASTQTLQNKVNVLREARNQTTGFTGAMSMMKTAASGVGVVFNALGGWITVLNLAISAGIAWWMRYGESAQRALDRARRARAGTSSLQDELDVKEKVASANKEIRRLQTELDMGKTFDAALGQMRVLQPKQKEALQARIQAAKTAIEGYNKELGDIAKSLAAQRAEDEANAEIFAFNQAFDKVKAEGEKRRSAIREQAEKDKKAIAEAGGKNAGAERLKVVDRAMADQQAIDEQNLAFAEGQLQSMRDRLGKSSGETSVALTKAIENVSSVVETLRSKVEGYKLRLTPNDFVPGKSQDKDPRGVLGEDKLAAFIAGLADDQAKVNESIRQLDELGDVVDKAAIARKGVLARWEAGGFDRHWSKSKGVDKPIPGLVDLAAQKAAELEASKQFAAGYDKLLDGIRQRKPEFERDAAFLANPNTEGRLDQEMVKLEAWLSKVTVAWDSLPEHLRAKKPEFDAAIAALMNQAQTSDLANLMRAQQRDLQELGIMNVTQERERAKVIIQIERDKQIAYLESLRVKRLSNNEPTADLDRLIDNANRIAADKTAKAGMTAIEKLALAWSDATAEMEQATANWAQGGIDAFMNFVETGKMQWGSLVKQILKDLLRIALQRMVANAIGSAFGMPGLGSSAPTIPAGSAPGGTYDIVPSGFRFAKFAKGGIMTAAGSLPLKRYAKGGIARSPQLALFGEGSQNEAYVPLPDGRTIPVTLRGGTPDVTVNVINQSGTQVNATQGEPRFDGRRMVLDVVLEGVSQPGSFRDGMKTMLSM